MLFWEKNVIINTKITRKMIKKFSRLTGDDAPHHLSRKSAITLGYENVIAQGLLVMSLTGRVSSQYLQEIERGGVSYGYEHVRFIKPIYPEMDLKITYMPTSMTENQLIMAEIIICNRSGETIFIANNLLKLL